MKEKELNTLKCLSCIFLVLGITFSTIYAGKNELVNNVIEYVSKPLVYPILLFVLGFRINTKKYKPELLLKFFVSLLIISILFNGFIYFIPNLLNNIIIFDSLFIINIFMIMSFTYLFFYIVKKTNMHLSLIWGIVLLFSVLNTFLPVYFEGFTSPNFLLTFILDLFYSYSPNSFFPLLGWLIFPVSGYIYSVVLESKNKSYIFSSGFLNLIIYGSLVTISLKLMDGRFVLFDDNISFYKMNIYSSIMNVSLCIFMYSFMYFFSKLIPNRIYKYMKVIGSNTYVIYIITCIFINYIFISYAHDLLRYNFIECFGIFLIILIISSLSSKIFMKKIENF